MAIGKSEKFININHKAIGRYGEKLVAKHLKRLGFKIIDQNVRLKAGEIDLIVKKGKEIIFVEIKTLRNPRGMRPIESVDWKKQKRLAKIGAQYLWENKIRRCPVSFMVVGVDLSKTGKERFEVIPRAFWVD